ncbi:MAG: arsenic efflux protein [Clostridia bacterium]|nr:arsenic efflux protein [Clostridia bacterium]
MLDVVLEAVFDTLKLLPFLFLLYILIEVMEHNTQVGKPRAALTGKWAPALGAGLGLVPMCGFSVMAAKLYEHRHITVGTLLAVFIATSDEGLLVLLLSSMELAPKLIAAFLLIGSKLVLGISAGYLFDLLLRKRTALAPLPKEQGHDHGHHVRDANHEEAHFDHRHEHGEEAHEQGDCACAKLSPCEHKRESKFSVYFLSPFLHALEVAGFVLVINLLFGFLFFGVGEENVIEFMQGAGYWIQPLLCALIGAIPNCAASVVLAEAFALGGIGFGGLLGGLVVNAGLGYLVLLKKKVRQSGIRLLAGMFLFAVAVGYLANALWLLI